MSKFRLISALVLMSIFSTQSVASLNIAVASNFKTSAQHIAKQFTKEFGIDVKLSSASTATLYQQVLRGAPFDVFLSADQKHIQLLVDAEKVEQPPFLYAQGRLVFWKPEITRVPTLQDFMLYNERLAIANPKFAPYGIAAQETLESMKKWQTQPYVKGNNINQAYQFVESKNVNAGLVSYAAVVQKKQSHFVMIPEEWHQPIAQYGIVLSGKSLEGKKAGDKKLHDANLFRTYLLSENTRNYIKSQGYN